MKPFVRRFVTAIIISITLTLLACDTIRSVDTQKPELFKLEKLFPTEFNPSVSFDKSISANPLLDFSLGKAVIIVPSSDGMITALNTETGAMVWEIKLPTPTAQTAQLIATPVIIGDKLVVIYQCLDQGVRSSHRLTVIDLTNKQLDDRFSELIITAEQPASDGVGTVKFDPPNAFSHAALKHLPRPDSELGYLYASFGNAGDTQPYHGWLFEIDLDGWRNQGSQQAIRNVLLTTPEAECPVTLLHGTQEMICGGGIWAPPGPQIFATDEDVEILIPTGNGQIDLARHDYANTLMRVKPGLQFDAACDAQLCANFNPSQPTETCMASCKNLFIPRLAAGNSPLKPANGECDDKSFWDCLAWMDYDLGANSPIKVKLQNGQSVLVQPGKDGGVYLVDAEHLGTQYDRLPIELCGTAADPCRASWMGMIVTQPVVAYFNNQPVVIVATFSPDKSHAAGLVALKIVENQGFPKLQRFWQFPNPNYSEALLTFRSHPSLPVITSPGNSKEPVVWVVDIGNHGTLYGIRIKDGQLVAKQILQGAGRPLSAPLIYNNRLYLTSIMPDTNKAMLEAYRIDPAD
ncbi:MAG: hypothetical protein Q7T40_01480 [Methylobacter sp.]|nr:hypothetical protein [Methylobacter sp.]